MPLSAAKAEPRCPGDRLPLLTGDTHNTPFVTLNAQNTSGAFLLDYGTTASSLSARAFPNTAPQQIQAQQFSLPSFTAGRFRLQEYSEPPTRQLGIVGTDFLSLLTADFSFHDPADVVLSSAPCDRATLKARNLVALRQAGHFSYDADRIRPDRPNVPVMPLRIGPITVTAQIDTGYDDRVLPPSIDINEPLFQALEAQGALRPAGTISVITCAGHETRQVYIAPDSSIAVTDDIGRSLHPLSNVKLIRKHAGPCGGIATHRQPSAQLGMSVLRQLGTVVFDPKSELVWIPAAPIP